MSDPAIERLNYFNGQRLEAADLKLEQDYHINVRRWLSRSLLTPGIAAGLEVTVKPGDPHTVLVDPGLALDALGREIILVDQVEFPVTGLPTISGAPVVGNYLVIEYTEKAVATVQDGCAVRLAVTCQAIEDLAWGAPSRILAEPKLTWQNQWPKLDPNKPADYKIVLAQVELDASCAVKEPIRSFVRKYVAAALPSRVRAVSIEGEREVDNQNAKELVFHIEGGVPDRFSLFLRARKFSTLYYTELGQHKHHISFLSGDKGDPAHKHQLKLDFRTKLEGGHGHVVQSHVDHGGDTGTSIVLNNTINEPDRHLDNAALTNMRLTGGDHDHGFSIPTRDTELNAVPDKHKHDVLGDTDPGGANIPARVGTVHTFVDDLHIKFDGQDVTALVLAQLQATAAAAWAKLGDGTGGHQLASAEGTGEIDLLQIGLDIHPGEHRLIFSIPPANTSGGTLQYSLYID